MHRHHDFAALPMARAIVVEVLTSVVSYIFHMFDAHDVRTTCVENRVEGCHLRMNDLESGLELLTDDLTTGLEAAATGRACTDSMISELVKRISTLEVRMTMVGPTPPDSP